MQANKTILVGGLVIISIGAINAAVNKKPETPVFAGGIGVLLLASLLDAISPQTSKIATGLVSLAALTVVLVEGPSLFTALANAQKASPTTTNTSKTPTSGGK